MSFFEDYKGGLLAYLYTEQSFEKRDIERFRQMTREEKIASDMLIPDIAIAKSENHVYVLDAPNNYSKLRSGDRVILKKEGGKSGVKALVIDTNTDTITVYVDDLLISGEVYDMEMDSPDLLSSLIGCLEGILPATPGA